MKNLAYLFIFGIFTLIEAESKFYVVRQWKYINFTWPNEESYKTAVSKGLYIPDNNIIAGVKYFEDHYYITLPRMKNGVPATLTRIEAGTTKDTSPNLEPFPSWSMNGVDDCNNLQNVQNVEIDTRGQLWIIDGGRINTNEEHPIDNCPPKLLIFDIKNNRTSTVYNFPEEVAAKNSSYLYDIVVDNTDGGYAYITDNSARDPGIIVFSLKENRAWKVRNNATMTADPEESSFNVNGIDVPAPINIAGIALGPKIRSSQDKVVVDDEKEVYFSPLSSKHLYSINTTTLHNEYLIKALTSKDIKDVGFKQSQSGAMVMDNRGVLYYTLLAENAIGRWDSHTPFSSGQKLIAKDKNYIEWPSSFAFDLKGNLTIMINRLNRFIYGKLELSEFNFRLITSDVGGRSYLYDDDFTYHAGESSSSPQPKPSSEPTPEPTPEPHADHDHKHDHTSAHVQVSTSTVQSTTGQSAGNILLTEITSIVFMSLLAFML